MNNAPEKKITLIERLQTEFTKLLVETPFPVEKVSSRWINTALKALTHSSPATSGVSHKDFVALAQLDSRKLQLSFNQFATLSNNLETKSAAQLQISIEDYCELMLESAEHIEFYSEQVALMRSQVEQQLAAEGLEEKKSRGALKLS